MIKKATKRPLSEAEWNCESLNELLRQKTGMGQGEIDSEAEDIKVWLKRKYRDAKST